MLMGSTLCCFSVLRYLIFRFLHPNPQRHPIDFEHATVFCEVDSDRHLRVYAILFFLLQWPIILAAGTIVQWLVKATVGLDTDGQNDPESTQNAD